jgi:ribosomal protein S27E
MAELTKVELHPETQWNWECPTCKTPNELYDEYDFIVTCENCGTDFEGEFQ